MSRGTDAVVVCSFYTADDYYRAHGDRLRSNLDDLGIAHELQEIVKQPGEDWADICRKKIAFLNRVCVENPDKKVFWVDVDCQILALPSAIADFTADLIGFQRGFGSPQTIGYAKRTRFWEPCFFGINTTKAGRKFMADAAALEQTLEIKATDDYFFEESWRANGAGMSFQVIPSGAVQGKASHGVSSFFVFGSSGNVAEFKGKVVQHTAIGGDAPSAGRRLRRRERGAARARALAAAKRLESRLTARNQDSAARLRRWADAMGLTHLLTKDAAAAGVTRARANLANQVLLHGQRGEVELMREAAAKLTVETVPDQRETDAVKGGESFAAYATGGQGKPVPLMWWARPFPGNFGDWLSPLLVQRQTGRPIQYVIPTAPPNQAHLALIGSIGRFIRPKSIVVGTGISSDDIELVRNATYLSTRGPLTADVLRKSGGPSVDSLGDPGALLSRLVPVTRHETNGRLALVRHFTHAALPATLPENMDELDVLVSHPDDLERFVTTLNGYDGVVTSAMHVMIACHSYGIPCALIGFKGFEDAVHGSGMKYRDYSLGIGLDEVWEPEAVAIDLTQVDWSQRLRTAKISDAKLDEIETQLNAAVERLG